MVSEFSRCLLTASEHSVAHPNYTISLLFTMLEIGNFKNKEFTIVIQVISFTKSPQCLEKQNKVYNIIKQFEKLKQIIPSTVLFLVSNVLPEKKQRGTIYFFQFSVYLYSVTQYFSLYAILQIYKNKFSQWRSQTYRTFFCTFCNKVIHVKMLPFSVLTRHQLKIQCQILPKSKISHLQY